jgi:alpha-1,6-mannosyltransferase
MSDGVGVIAASPRGLLARPGSAGLGRAQAAVALAGLLLLGLSGAWMAFAAASNDWIVDSNAPEPHWLRGPLAGLLPSLTDPSFSLLLVLMLVGYATALAGARLLPEPAAMTTAFGLVALFGLAPVVLSSDLFGYLAYARLELVHHLNPYTHAAAATPHDPVYPYVYWIHATSPYGPLYSLVAVPAAAVGVPAGVWALKTLSTLGCVLALVLIARAAPRYGRAPGPAALLVAGNPVLLVFAVGGGHNDLIVMAAVAGAILLLARERTRVHAGALLAVATALKATGGLVAPFALLAVRPRRNTLIGFAHAGALLASITLAVFGVDVVAQIGRIATGGDFVADYSGPDALGRLLGTGVTTAVRVGCGTAAAVVTLTCLWRVHRGADWLAAAAISGLAILCTIPSLAPWYVAWVLPAAALARGAGARWGTVAISAALLVTHLPALGFAPY